MTAGGSVCKIKGIVTEIIFENEESGFKICELETADEIVTVKGTLPFVQVGETVVLEGSWVTHDVYGDQFSAVSFEKEFPQDEVEHQQIDDGKQNGGNMELQHWGRPLNRRR